MSSKPIDKPYLFVKHSQNWNVDRCTRWMERQGHAINWCYPVEGDVFPDPRECAGVIVFGGANSANDCRDHEWVRREMDFIERCLKEDLPFFGICLGAQILARVLGASVGPHDDAATEIGFLEVRPVASQNRFLERPLTVMQWHAEGFDLPAGTARLAESDLFPNQAYALGEKVIGVQFHPEVNPEVLAIWHTRNKETRPEQFTDVDRAVMMRDAIAHDAVISDWLDGTLQRWRDCTA